MKFILTSLILLFGSTSFAQTLSYPWATQVGGTSEDRSLGVAVDAQGNVYTCGLFSGTARFGTTTLISAGDKDIFLFKQDSLGNHLWARRAGGDGYDDAYGIAFSPSGEIYLTGNFSNSAQFGNLNLVSAGPSNTTDIFVVKYSSDGDPIWARSAGGNLLDQSYGITADRDGNIVIAGFIMGTANFSGTALTATDLRDIFLAKYNSSGTLVWARKAGGPDFEEVNDVASDAQGNYIITGYFKGRATFETTILNSNSNSEDIFIAKYSAAGSLIWAKAAGGSGADAANSIAVDDTNNIIISGRFEGNASFEGFNVGAIGQRDAFIAKYKRDGNVLWVKSEGGSTFDESFSVATDAVGGIYSTGYFTGRANFGGQDLTSNGDYDMFIAYYNPDGTMIWRRSSGGQSLDNGRGVATSKYGNVYVLGSFQSSSLTINTVSPTILSTRGDFDGFLLKIKISPAPVGNKPLLSNNFTIVQSPKGHVLEIHNISELPYKAVILDAMGRTVLSSNLESNGQIELPNLANGTYILHLIDQKQATHLTGRFVYMK